MHTGGKLGVMVEVNCETDFVSKGDKFKELCKMLAMQIAACPGVEYVKAEDISEEARAKERALEMKSEDLEGKPEAIKEKMVEGRVNKMFKEKIVGPEYIKDDSMTVATCRELRRCFGGNIQVSVRTFRLGETQAHEARLGKGRARVSNGKVEEGVSGVHAPSCRPGRWG